MANVQIAIRLGGKPGSDGRVFFRAEVLLSDLPDEIEMFCGRRFGGRMGHGVKPDSSGRKHAAAKGKSQYGVCTGRSVIRNGRLRPSAGCLLMQVNYGP